MNNPAAIFLDRLYKAIGHDNLYSWGRHAGITDGTLQTIKRSSIPKAEGLLAISDATGKSIDWLLGRDGVEKAQNNSSSAARASGNAYGEFVYIPRYDAQELTGEEHWTGDESRAKFMMAFRRYWVENYLHARPEDLSVLRVHGDSMVPALQEGDNILVNHARTSPQDGIYVIRVDGQVLVKRLQRLHGPCIRVISANADYPPYEVPIEDAHDQRGFAVIGRVVWFGRQL
ncbi:hypothetical protein DFQ28_007810 [Apophysomyces sp. BC1034]|nr:hypothetical protein DFQ30_000568 [Apophysomyces sp. BC1015]KAG0194664.1 hypothetical protein DFQ28_007810 [Apophysomyces sp. BC1034]